MVTYRTTIRFTHVKKLLKRADSFTPAMSRPREDQKKRRKFTGKNGKGCRKSGVETDIEIDTKA